MPRLSQFITEIQKLKQLFTVITGKEISEISMFFAEYKWTDHLLTHEDDLQNRVIAFVYYLNRNRFKIFKRSPEGNSVLNFAGIVMVLETKKVRIGQNQTVVILKRINRTQQMSQSESMNQFFLNVIP